MSVDRVAIDVEHVLIDDPVLAGGLGDEPVTALI